MQDSFWLYESNEQFPGYQNNLPYYFFSGSELSTISKKKAKCSKAVVHDNRKLQ